MSKTYKYGVYGVGRIGKVHAAIVREQGHQIVAIGDDAPEAVIAAQDELNLGGVKAFHDPAQMAHEIQHQTISLRTIQCCITNRANAIII